MKSVLSDVVSVHLSSYVPYGVNKVLRIKESISA